jgi:hypothetical protein
MHAPETCSEKAAVASRHAGPDGLYFFGNR